MPQHTTKTEHVHIYIPPIPTSPFDESVYDMIPVALPIKAKPPPYVSKYNDQVKQEYTLSMKQKPRPVNSAKTVFSYPPPRKEPLPNACPRLKNRQVSTDFVKSNRTNAAHLVPPPVPLKKMYKDQPKFGNVPKYLCKMSRPTQPSTEQTVTESNELVRIPDAERLAIQQGLQLNWDKLNSEYQKLSLTVDTVPKIARKVNMEQQLKRIEEDIRRFAHENIYVRFEA